MCNMHMNHPCCQAMVAPTVTMGSDSAFYCRMGKRVIMNLFAIYLLLVFLCLSDTASAFMPSSSSVRHIHNHGYQISTSTLPVRSAAEMIQNGGNRTPVAAKTYGSTKMKLGAGESLDVEVPLPAAVAVAASPAALELQNELRRLSANTSNRELADGDRRARIELAAKELNALNPIAEPARSPLLAGKWRLLYSTVPGPSSGRFGPFVADVFQDLRPDEKIIFNILELGPSWALRGALEAAVEVLDGSTWAITFDKVYNYLAGVKIQEKKFDVGTERRIWEMTYLDRDFRVLYGRKEDMASEEGFIFILEREKD